MRKNGFKSVAILTNYAVEALQNALFYDVFGQIDAAITGGEQKITETSTNVTLGSMDQLSLYLNDRNPSGSVIVCLSRYAQAIRRMSGFAEYMSDAMKNDFNRYGLVKTYDGIGVAAISGAKKLGNGQLLIPDKKIFGIADKIGSLDMKGEVRVYEDMDNQKEVVKVAVKDFTYGFAITDIDNVAKIVIEG